MRHNWSDLTADSKRERLFQFYSFNVKYPIFVILAFTVVLSPRGSLLAQIVEDDESTWPRELRVIEEKYLPPDGTYAATPKGWQNLETGKIYDEKWLKEEKGITPERYMTIIPQWVDGTPEEQVPLDEVEHVGTVELDDDDPLLGDAAVAPLKDKPKGPNFVSPRPFVEGPWEDWEQPAKAE